MLDYVLVFALLFLGGCLSLISTEKARSRAFVVYSFISLPALFLFAGLRGPHVDNDYQNYVEWFNGAKSESLGLTVLLRDPTFWIISSIVQGFGEGIASVMGIYAAICLLAQMLFAKWVLASRWTPLGQFLILCRFFIPHEMTQIRAGVAISLVSLSILLFLRKEPRKGSAVFVLASLFHASVLLVFPVILLIILHAQLRSRAWVVGLLPLAIVGKLLFGYALPLFTAWSRLGVYVSGDYETRGIRLLSAYVLFRALPLSFLCLGFWDRLTAQERILCFCSGLGLCLQVMFSANDAIALRSAEVFGLFDISVAILVFRFLRPRTAVTYALCLLAAGGLFFRSGTAILQPYKTILSSER